MQLFVFPAVSCNFVELRCKLSMKVMFTTISINERRRSIIIIVKRRLNMILTNDNDSDFNIVVNDLHRWKQKLYMYNKYNNNFHKNNVML